MVASIGALISEVAVVLRKRRDSVPRRPVNEIDYSTNLIVRRRKFFVNPQGAVSNCSALAKSRKDTLDRCHSSELAGCTSVSRESPRTVSNVTRIESKQSDREIKRDFLSCVGSWYHLQLCSAATLFAVLTIFSFPTWGL